jgi:predicted alpha/beta superfamily hydrolase
LSGWSFGGLFTFRTFLDHPEAFSAYLAISPSLWWEQDAVVGASKAMFAKRRVSDRPLVVTLGCLEGGDMDPSVRNGLLPPCRPVADS